MNIKISIGIVAAALVAIALNMTYSNLHQQPTQTSALVREEKVLPVIGRVTTSFDGFGAHVGFLARDGNNLTLVHFDPGSMADNSAFEPKYIVVTTLNNGQTVLDPVTVEQFR